MGKRLLVLILFVAVVTFPVMGNAAPTAAAPTDCRAVVDNGFSGAEGSEIAGAKVYKSIGKAIAEAPQGLTEPYRIFIKAGTYYEQVKIDKPFIALLGESKESTEITFDATVGSKKTGGKNYTQDDSATLTVAAAKCTLENLTITNTAVSNGKNKTIAMKTDYGSSRAMFKNLRVLGSYGTIYLSGGTQFYNQCYVTGYDEFIFGAGQAVFDDCDIVSKKPGSRGGQGPLFLTNQAVLFINSRLQVW